MIVNPALTDYQMVELHDNIERLCFVSTTVLGHRLKWIVRYLKNDGTPAARQFISS
jgi:hypothetical protein